MSLHRIAGEYIWVGSPSGNGYCRWKGAFGDDIEGFCFSPCDSEEPYVMRHKDGRIFFAGPVHKMEDGVSTPMFVQVTWIPKGYSGKDYDSYELVSGSFFYKKKSNSFWGHHNCRVQAGHTMKSDEG